MCRPLGPPNSLGALGKCKQKIGGKDTFAGQPFIYTNLVKEVEPYSISVYACKLYQLNNNGTLGRVLVLLIENRQFG